MQRDTAHLRHEAAMILQISGLLNLDIGGRQYALLPLVGLGDTQHSQAVHFCTEVARLGLGQFGTQRLHFLLGFLDAIGAVRNTDSVKYARAAGLFLDRADLCAGRGQLRQGVPSGICGP